MKRNLTLSLDEDLLSKARVVAAKRHTSLTQMVRDYLDQIVNAETDAADAWRRMKRRIARSTFRVGDATWTRDEIHER